MESILGAQAHILKAPLRWLTFQEENPHTCTLTPKRASEPLKFPLHGPVEQEARFPPVLLQICPAPLGRGADTHS